MFPVEVGCGLTFRSAEAAASGSETSIICLPGMYSPVLIQQYRVPVKSMEGL